MKVRKKHRQDACATKKKGFLDFARNDKKDCLDSRLKYAGMTCGEEDRKTVDSRQESEDRG